MFGDRWDNSGQVLSRMRSAVDSILCGGGPVYYVDSDNGNNGYDGLSWETAKATIAAGVAMATVDNCTVFVAGENYSEPPVTVSVNQLKILAVCRSKEMPLWQNSTPAVGSHILVQGSQCEIAGFRFHHGASSTKPSIILDGGNSGNAAYIHKNYFTSSGSSSGSAGVEMLHSGFDHDISDNEFFNLQGSGKYSGAIYQQSSHANWPVGCTIRNNRIFICATAISIPGSFCSIIGNHISGFAQDGTEKTEVYLNLTSSVTSAHDEGDHVDFGGNIVACNHFPDHFSWEINSVQGYWFSDTDSISGNFCKDGVMGRGGPSSGGADAHDTQLVPGKRYVMSKALTGGWGATTIDLFNIVGGPIRVISLSGTVTAAIENTTMDLSLVAAVTTPSGNVTIASSVDAADDDPGTLFTLPTTFGGTLVEATVGCGANGTGADFIMPVGTINMTSGHIEGDSAGIKWVIEFIPLVPGVSVTPA